MVTRVYICDSCESSFELDQPIKEEPIKACLKCGNHVYQDYSGISFSIKGNVKTVLQQAEKNDKKLGKYKLEELRAKDKEVKERASDITAEKLGLKKPQKTNSKKWWGKLSKEKEREIFDKQTPKEKNEAAKKYILEGK